MHSPPPPRKCSAVVPPSVPSPPPRSSRDAGQSAGQARTPGRSSTGAESPGGSRRSPPSSLPFIQSPATGTGTEAGKVRVRALYETPRNQWPDPMVPFGEGRPATWTRAPPRLSLESKSSRVSSTAGRHLPAAAGVAFCLVLTCRRKEVPLTGAGLQPTENTWAAAGTNLMSVSGRTSGGIETTLLLTTETMSSQLR